MRGYAEHVQIEFDSEVWRWAARTDSSWFFASVPEELSAEMLDILHAQEFRNGIPARLPPAVRVAHKTGDISTVAHDAGVVYPPGRKPYVIAILTEWAPDATRRSAAIAAASRAVYELLAGGDGANDG